MALGSSLQPLRAAGGEASMAVTGPPAEGFFLHHPWADSQAGIFRFVSIPLDLDGREEAGLHACRQ